MLPSSHSEFKLPESNVMTISIAKEVTVIGNDTTHIWMGLDSQILRQRLFTEYKNIESVMREAEPTSSRTI